MVTAAAIVKEVASGLQRKQSMQVAKIMAIAYDNASPNSFNENDRVVEAACRSTFRGGGEPYCDVMIALLKAKRLAYEHKYVLAYEEHIAGFIKFLEIFREETGWLVPWLHVMVYDSRILARHADKEASTKRGDEINDNVKNAEQHLKRAFSMTVNDRGSPDVSKKPGTLYIVNQLFKIYFHLNAISLCRNLIRAVELQDFDRFPKRDQVTYQYYLGRIYMFEDQYHKAEECLNFAWRHCHKAYTRNKRQILQFLVPVKLILGVVPSPELFQTYELDEYVGIATSIQQGNISEFNNSMSKFEDQFVQEGVYLLMEKLRPIVMRNLLKKVYLIREKKNQLKLADFQLAIDAVGGAGMDMDDIESLVANLIFKGYVKGYISHKLKVLVLSKSTPFPVITDVIKDTATA
ncbi:Aste57867_23090 [Aphanomyces stellatus]|uniref:Aste57867_23090 protein n=1 Tax=Aphanomyces stellatus TaxID=120398 RepID=A0A485LMV4_9STRA|nr:hypothetical protein As57867_023019 [Aphanomyces stellatus]VFT99738.1 Aste57867_23090 [Aphanomyces stellatus]